MARLLSGSIFLFFPMKVSRVHAHEYKMGEIPLRRPLVTVLNEQTEKMQVDSTCTCSHQLQPQQAAYVV